MPRGAEYDNGVPQSDNAIEAGQTQAHGTGNAEAGLNRTTKTAEFPEGAIGTGTGGGYSGGGSGGPTKTGSGKGGHEPNTLGENKGLGA